VHGCTNVAGAGMRRSDEVHGCTNVAGAGMRRSDQTKSPGAILDVAKQRPRRGEAQGWAEQSTADTGIFIQEAIYKSVY